MRFLFLTPYRSLGLMKCRIFPVAALFCPLFALADTASQQLTITVTTPKVAVAPLPAGRQFVTLPGLEYWFLLEPRCSGGSLPRSVSLSIADSRQVFPAEALDAHGFVSVKFSVPAAQLAPLPVSGFCQAPGTSDQPGVPLNGSEKKIGAAASAHAALLCIREDGSEKISYATKPLAVTLQCTAVADDGADEPAQPVITPAERSGAVQETRE